MAQVKDGDSVTVHYTGKLDDGEVFDSSRERDPFKFKVGAGQVIPGFDNGVVGMEVGQTKTVEIPPDDGYGQQRTELFVKVHRADFPEDIAPEIGQQLQMKRPDGTPVNVTVSEVSEEDVTLDANHPLAGKTLTFEIELMEIG